MARPRKQPTVEDIDARIEQLKGEIETLYDRINKKKNEVTRLRNQRKRVEQARLIELINESGRDYSELLDMFKQKEDEDEE